MEKAKGKRLNGKDKTGKFRQSSETTAEKPKTLKDLRLTKDQSSLQGRQAAGRQHWRPEIIANNLDSIYAR